MSSTRHAAPNAPLSAHRHMSSEEYALTRRVGITEVATKCRSPYLTEDGRQLLLFLQGLTIEKGGLVALVQDFIDQCAEGFVSAHREETVMEEFEDFTSRPILEEGEGEELPRRFTNAGTKKEATKTCKMDRAQEHKCSIHGMHFTDGQAQGLKGRFNALLQSKKRGQPKDMDREAMIEACQVYAPALEIFLMELLTNPLLGIYGEGEDERERHKADAARREIRCPDGKTLHFADVPYFEGIIPALFRYVEGYRDQIRESFILTEIGEQVQSTLEKALHRGEMALIFGREGRGKSEAAKAWCQANHDKARLVKLTGSANKTAVFAAICEALGLPQTTSFKAVQMQLSIEKYYKTARTMLVIDEAHFLLPQGTRVDTRPELIDWIDTALCNNGIPVAFVTTPQFIDQANRITQRTGWNADQFKRRAKHTVMLPEVTPKADMVRIARKHFPHFGNAILEVLAAHAGVCRKDLSGLGDLIREIKEIAKVNGHTEATPEDVGAAMDIRLASEKFLDRLDSPKPKTKEYQDAILPVQPVRKALAPVLQARQEDTPKRATRSVTPAQISPTDRTAEAVGTLLPV